MKNLNTNFSQEELTQRFMDLVIRRIYRKFHSSLSVEGQKEMERIFEKGNEKEKLEFIKKYLGNFEEIFKKELEETAIQIINKLGIQINRK